MKEKVRVIELTGDYPLNAFGAKSITYRLDEEWGVASILEEIKDQLIENADEGETWTLTLRLMDEDDIEALPELD